jgi:hypothetical protein
LDENKKRSQQQKARNNKLYWEREYKYRKYIINIRNEEKILKRV